MEILTSQLPSGGYDYDFSSISLEPMTFLEMTKYMETTPSDPIEKYLHDIQMLTREEPKILDCYVLDLDFLIFYKKLISVSKDFTYSMTVKCPHCGKDIKRTISMDRDVVFKQLEENVMSGAIVELCGTRYDVKVPTVRDFLKVLDTILRYNRIKDLNLIKTVALVGDFGTQANDIQKDVLGAKLEDITLLLALRELYFDRVEPIEIECPGCLEGKTGNTDNTEEGGKVTVSVASLIVDFFRDICINSPIDGSKILFK